MGQRFRRGAIAAAVLIAVAPFVSIGAASAAQAGQIAGYQRTVSAAKDKVLTTFVVPTIVSCPPYFAGIVQGTLLSTSAGHNGGGVQLLCNFGAPGYLAFAQINGTGTGLSDTVNPGDTVSVSVSETATATSVKVKDTTGGWSTTTTGGGGTVSAAEVGMIAGNCLGTACSPIIDFTTTSFSASSINGQPLTGSSHVKLVSSSGTVEASASSLGAGGTSFTTTWKSSCTPDSSGRC